MRLPLLCLALLLALAVAVPALARRAAADPVVPAGLRGDPVSQLSGGRAAGLLRRAGADVVRRVPERPVAPRRAYPVGGRVDVGDGFGDRPNHQGVDLMSACGTPLRAVVAGRVSRVASHAAAGTYVVLRAARPRRDLVYMHLSHVDVGAGERVRAGERLGDVGRTGNATACHLHFETWRSPGWQAGAAYDPEPLLRRLR